MYLQLFGQNIIMSFSNHHEKYWSDTLFLILMKFISFITTEIVRNQLQYISVLWDALDSRQYDSDNVGSLKCSKLVSLGLICILEESILYSHKRETDCVIRSQKWKRVVILL